MFKYFFASFLILFTFALSAQEESNVTGFISDELFIYMHTGAGNNYRITGTITAGSEVILTGQEKNNYIELIDTKGKTAWVESKYVSTTPGLRNVIAELNSRLATYADVELKNQTKLSESSITIETLTSNNNDLTAQVAQLEQELTRVKSKIKHQDQEMLTQWFFNGAIVLGIGLFLGVLLPRLVSKKRKTSSWS